METIRTNATKIIIAPIKQNLINIKYGESFTGGFIGGGL